MQLIDFGAPATSAARAALEIATTYHSPAMLNHCHRSYLWGAAHGRQLGLPVDDELLYVAAMLHDLGLVKEFDSVTVPFEEAGGHVAWVFAAGAGWPVARRTRVAEVIVRHMWDSVDPQLDAEGYLLEVGTGLDISGRDPGRWSATFRAEVLAAFPRGTLQDEFVACFRDQASRKPASLAAGLVRAGIAERMATNALQQHDVQPQEGAKPASGPKP